MPYISQERRDELEDISIGEGLYIRRMLDPGGLNYVLTRFVSEWLGSSPTYTHYNAALGVLEAVKQELYRRRIAPYEDYKCEENGDVY